MFKKKIFSKFYKLIKIFIFFSFYKKIEKIIKANETKNIDIKKIFFNGPISYNFYKIPNGRIYSTTVHDTAFILDKNLIEETSFQYRYDKNDRIFNAESKENIVFKNGTPNFLKKINGSVFSLLCGGAGKNNYWHWIFDVLPRIGIFEKSNLKIKPNYYLLPSLSKKYQKESLIGLKIFPSTFINGERYKHIMCDNLIAVDHPVNFENNPSKSILDIPYWIIDWLRKKYIKKNYKNLNTPKKIFIDSESNPLLRRIINNEEVKNILIKLDFKIISLSKLKFQDQIKLFRNANFIIGLHGAGFANMVFSKPNTKIIEIASYKSGDVILNLAKKCKLNYKRIIEKNLSYSLKFQNSHINVDITKLKKLILSYT